MPCGILKYIEARKQGRDKKGELMIPEKFLITMDSFGAALPDNWQEIADYLNELLSELWEKSESKDDFKEAVEEVWDQYCNDLISGAPKAILSGEAE